MSHGSDESPIAGVLDARTSLIILRHFAVHITRSAMLVWSAGRRPPPAGFRATACCWIIANPAQCAGSLRQPLESSRDLVKAAGTFVSSRLLVAAMILPSVARLPTRRANATPDQCTVDISALVLGRGDMHIRESTTLLTSRRQGRLGQHAGKVAAPALFSASALERLSVQR